MTSGWNWYFETGPYVMSVSGVIGALYCRYFRTERLWNLSVMLLVFAIYYLGFALFTLLTIKSRGANLKLAVVIYLVFGSLIFGGMIPNFVRFVGVKEFEKQLSFYEAYWLFVAGLGVVLETVRRLGIA